MSKTTITFLTNTRSSISVLPQTTIVDTLRITAYHGLVSSSSTLYCFNFFDIYVFAQFINIDLSHKVLNFIIFLACYYCPNILEFLIWIYFQIERKKHLFFLHMINDLEYFS